MTIPKSYEALAADLASEKIISKTLQGQKESYMMLADGRKFDLDAIQQRLTVAEQRAEDLKKLLCDVINEAPTGFAALKVDLANRVNDALNPADHPQCEECKGWGYHENHYDGGGTECGECGGSGNASVELVMPERLNTEGGYSLEADTWCNLALDDVVGLNGVTK